MKIIYSKNDEYLFMANTTPTGEGTPFEEKAKKKCEEAVKNLYKQAELNKQEVLLELKEKVFINGVEVINTILITKKK